MQDQDQLIDATALERVQFFINQAAASCVHNAEGMLRHRFVTPTYAINAGADDNNPVADRSLVGHYLQMYDWDACFFSQASHLVGIEGLAIGIIENFLALKHENGYVPRTVSPNKTWDDGDHCKPFLCQTLLKELELNNQVIGEDRLTQLVRDLVHYLSYFHEHRRHESGLYHWRNVLESGVDNNLALLPPHEAAQSENQTIIKYPDDRLLAVDLNSYLVAEFQSIAILAQMCNMDDTASEYREHAADLVDNIESHLWCEELDMYCNLNPTTETHVEIRAWTGLAPLIVGFAPPARVERMIEQNILSEQHFLRPRGLASLASSEPLYNNAKRGLYGRAIVCNWQGPVWTLPNALIARALVREGRVGEAAEIGRRVVANLYNDITHKQTIHESYDAETGVPVWAPQFMSWNILALELIELVAAQQTEVISVA